MHHLLKCSAETVSLTLLGIARPYISNRKCKECHETIYEEYSRSAHARSYFAYRFFKEGKPIVIPTPATSAKVNNLPGKESRILHYKIPGLKKGDRVSVTLYARLAKEECLKAITLENKSFTTPMIIKRLQWVVP